MKDILTSENINNAMDGLRKNIEYIPTVLVHNKQEWLRDSLMEWSEQEIDAADEKGLIGTKYGVDCYLSRPVSAI